MDLRDAAQRRELRHAATVGEPPVLHEQREMRSALGALAPAVAIAGGGKPELLSRRELHIGAPLDLGAEGIEPAILDGVFEPRVLAVLAVAPVALHGDDRLGDRHRVLRLAKAEKVGGARIGVRLAMGHAHAAADRDIPARDFSGGVEDGDETEIVGEDVDVVRRRHRHDDLEFARQISPAVDRLDDLVLAAGDLFAVEPDFAIGRRPRRQAVGNGARQRQGAGMGGRAAPA